MDQNRTPLVDAINQYKNKNTVRFHVPGHKGRMAGSFLSGILPYDVTEIPGLDDLHHPEEAILEAQQLAAEAFHADETFFLVGGSTAGNLAMIVAACKPGETILVQRNVHKSVINGLIFAAARPVYLFPETDVQTGLPITVSLPELERMLERHPEAKAVFLCNPNYYGMSVDLTPYAKLCRKYNLPLLVDEAHGAHFGQVKGMPISAMQAGAAAAVQSTHKMLPAMTMCSMLHVQGNRLDRERLRKTLAMVQSSSPSYPLMASLDESRRYMAQDGKKDLLRVHELVQSFVQAIEEAPITGLDMIRKSPSYDFLDPLKITLRTNSGFALKDYLEASGIYPELADEKHVLLALSPQTNEEDLRRTLAALQTFNQHVELGSTEQEDKGMQLYRRSPELVLTPYEVFHQSSQRISFIEAVGKISAEMIVPYPPGIPTVSYGERLEADTIQYLTEFKRKGGRFHGVSDSSLETIRVIVE